jgi:hypothetical protein
MDVNEWMSYEPSDEGTSTQNIHQSSTRSHASEEENRSENCKCKWVFRNVPDSLLPDNEWYQIVGK